MITDTSGTQIALLNYLQGENADSGVAIIRIDCHAGYFLKADANSFGSVTARPHGSGSYVDIHTSPISLSPFDGTQHDFDIKVHSGGTPSNTAIQVRVTNN
jgi:hypothetical protein